METTKGRGDAILVIDYGIDYDLQWVVALKDGGQCWCVSNPNVRFVTNISFDRKAEKICSTSLPQS